MLYKGTEWRALHNMETRGDALFGVVRQGGLSLSGQG